MYFSQYDSVPEAVTVTEKWIHCYSKIVREEQQTLIVFTLLLKMTCLLVGLVYISEVSCKF